MKKSILILAALVAQAFSAPTYFIFTGRINFIPSDNGGYAAAHDIKVGNTVVYVFAVDTTQNGYTQDGSVRTDKNDINNTGYKSDNFLDTLIYPSLFSPAFTDISVGSFFGYRNSITSGAKTTYTEAFQTILGNGTQQTQLIIYIPDTSATDWLPKVGTAVTATEVYAGPSSATSSASMTMTCTSVGSTKPAIGIRAGRGPSQPWLRSGIEGGALIIRNGSGSDALMSLLDARGKTGFAMRVGEKTLIPVSALPRGRYLLEVTAPGRTRSVQSIALH